MALSLPDLAHLLGISVDAVQNTIKKHDQVILPTRGRIADMGSTLSHSEKISALYMDGYTETEIKRRTEHSLDSRRGGKEFLLAEPLDVESLNERPKQGRGAAPV